MLHGFAGRRDSEATKQMEKTFASTSIVKAGIQQGKAEKHGAHLVDYFENHDCEGKHAGSTQVGKLPRQLCQLCANTPSSYVLCGDSRGNKGMDQRRVNFLGLQGYQPTSPR